MPVEYHWAGVAIFGLLVLALAISLVLPARSETLKAATFVLSIALSMTGLNALLHTLFGTPFLWGRTALVLYPPLIVGLFFGLDGLWAMTWKIEVVARLILIPFLLLLGYNFYRSYSPHLFREWPVQSDTQSCLDQVQAARAKSVGMNEWHYAVLVNYYQLAFPGRYTFPFHKIYPQRFPASALSRFDYLILSPGDCDKLPLKSWRIVACYPGSGALILKNEAVALLVAE